MQDQNYRTLLARGPVGAWKGVAFLAVLCGLGLLARIWVYARIENVLHGDSAVQGLIARHILGGEVQLYTYGLTYLGTLQAHWSALCFALFGQSTFVLKWAAGVESLALIATAYLLGREMAGGDRRAGWLAALLTAVGPLYLLEWSLRPRGGYIQAPTFSALAVWATLRACRHAGGAAASKAAARRYLAVAGFVLGLAWWAHLTAIYAVVTCLLAFLWLGGKMRRDRWIWILLVGGFAVGSLPFWLYNIKFRGASFLMFSGGGRDTWLPEGIVRRARGAATVALPILLGARQTEAPQSFGVLFCLAAFVGYGALLASTVTARSLNADRRRAAAAIGLIFLAIAFGIYILTPYGSYPTDPRYLLPIYAVLAPMAAGGAVALWDRRGASRPAGAVLVGAVLCVSLAGYRRGEREVIQPFGAEQRVPADLSPLIEYLDSRGITRVFTNYYIGYRLDFETQERIVTCTHGDPMHELYEPYRQAVLAAEPPAAFIVGRQAATWLALALESRGITHRRQSVLGYEVFYDLSAPFLEYPPGPHFAIPLTVEVGSYPKSCGPRQSFEVEVTVENRSLIAWPAPPERLAVLLSYHLLDPQTGEMIRFDNRRVLLADRPVAPGQSVAVAFPIEAPPSPGRYAFVADLVIEHVAWLSKFQPDLLAKPQWCEFTVRSAPDTER